MSYQNDDPRAYAMSNMMNVPVYDPMAYYDRTKLYSSTYDIPQKLFEEGMRFLDYVQKTVDKDARERLKTESEKYERLTDEKYDEIYQEGYNDAEQEYLEEIEELKAQIERLKCKK